MNNESSFETLSVTKLKTYCWFGSAVFAKPCLRYLTSVGFTGTGATLGSFLASLSI